MEHKIIMKGQTKGVVLNEKMLLLTSILSLPLNSEESLAMRSCLSARDATSQTEPVTLYPFVFHSFKDSLSSASFRAQVCTVAPSCANSSTIAYL